MRISLRTNGDAFASVWIAFGSTTTNFMQNHKRGAHTSRVTAPADNVKWSLLLILNWLVNWFKLMLTALCLIDNNYGILYFSMSWIFAFRHRAVAIDVSDCIAPVVAHTSRIYLISRHINCIFEKFLERKNGIKLWRIIFSFVKCGDKY